MQPYDIAMIFVLAATTVYGFWKGLAWQVASVCSLVASYFVALRFSDQLAPMISAQAPWNKFLAMLALYLGTSAAIWLAFRIVSGAIDRVKLHEFDRQAGGLVGAIARTGIGVKVRLLHRAADPQGDPDHAPRGGRPARSLPRTARQEARSQHPPRQHRLSAERSTVPEIGRHKPAGRFAERKSASSRAHLRPRASHVHASLRPRLAHLQAVYGPSRSTSHLGAGDWLDLRISRGKPHSGPNIRNIIGRWKVVFSPGILVFTPFSRMRQDASE